MKNISKITLYNLDGTISEMKLIMPQFDHLSESQETATVYLDQIVQCLTRFFIKIRGYRIEMGVINDQGEESYCCYYAPFEVPLNKVYVPSNDYGQWVDIDDMKKAKEAEKFIVVTRPDMRSSTAFLN